MKDDGRAPAAELGGEVILIEEGEGESAAAGGEGVDEAEGEAGALEGAEGLLDLVVAAHEERVAAEAGKAGPIDGVVVGRIVGFGQNGDPLVEAVVLGDGARGGVPARAMTALGPEDAGREVALLFEGGRRDRPVVMGRMHVAAEGAGVARRADATATATADGERLVLTAEKEIVLQCGKASITLTRAGKILIRGAYLLTRSSGVNRIQGGSVQIN